MALGFTQTVTEMSTRNISLGGGGGGGKGTRGVRLTTIPPLCANCLKIWKPQCPGTLRACPGLLWDCFTLQLFYKAVSSADKIWHYVACGKVAASVE
jgi:hypothetical protein